MSNIKIIKIIEESYTLLEELRRVGTIITKVSKDKYGYYKTKKKVCSKGMKWSSSKNTCIKQSPKEKAARKKAGIKISRSLKANMKGSKLARRNRLTKRTMKARNSLVEK
jgi:hypothetical protein